MDSPVTSGWRNPWTPILRTACDTPWALKMTMRHPALAQFMRQTPHRARAGPRRPNLLCMTRDVQNRCTEYLQRPIDDIDQRDQLRRKIPGDSPGERPSVQLHRFDLVHQYIKQDIAPGQGG